MDDEEVGEKFCRALAILSNNTDPNACMKAWDKAKRNEITQETLNEYLNETYGEGLPHKTKEIILELIQVDSNAK